MEIFEKDGKWIIRKKDLWQGKEREINFLSQDDALEWLKQEEKKRAILERKPKAVLGKNISVRTLLKAYLSTIQNSTTAAQTGYHAAQVVEAFGKRQARLVRPGDIRNFIEYQLAKGVAQITVNRRVSILRTAISWGIAQGIWAENWLSSIRLPRAVPKRIFPPTPAELKKMLKVSPPHLVRIIFLGVYTGARVGPSELFSIRWEDVDMENRVLNLQCAKKNHHVTTRLIPLNTILFRQLAKWQKEDKPQGKDWIIHYNGKKVRKINNAWKTMLNRAGIQRAIRPYDLRHAYATYAIAGGADIKALAETMGHTDATMILKTYQHVLSKQKWKVVEVLPAIC